MKIFAQIVFSFQTFFKRRQRLRRVSVDAKEGVEIQGTNVADI
jgi:uncharacterized membrane protein YdbT with pleckstrin-like domain